MRCDSCGAKIPRQAPGMPASHFCPGCAPKVRTCECENPMVDDDRCLRCARFLLPPARPKRAGRLVPPR